MTNALPISAAAEHVTAESVIADVRRDGFRFVNGTIFERELLAGRALQDWDQFANSWQRLAADTYMADHGRYRQRRHAVFRIDQTSIKREEHRAHFQALDYNALNGGVERWFEPIETAAGASASLRAILELCRAMFSALSPETDAWNVEVHQFRIIATSTEMGQPTPEGVHRDGVDFVLVLMVRRENIASGTTHIRTEVLRNGVREALDTSFTLTEPFDAAILDDHRARHGVTAVTPIDAGRDAYRDVLVVTFRRAVSPQIS